MIFVLLHTVYEKIILFVVKRKGTFYLKSNKQDRERILKVFNKTFGIKLKNFRMTIILLSIFVIPSFSNALVLFPALLIYIIYYLEKFAKDIAPHLTLTSASVIITLFTIITTLVNSYNKRFEKDSYTISFIEDNKLITTDKKLSRYNYLGETSSNIFIYDLEKKESKIYFKDKISDIRIKNSNNIDSSILAIKNNSFVKFYLQRLNEKE